MQLEGGGQLSLKICTSEYMLSDPNGVGPSRTWYPRIVAERFLESTKDGKIDRAPDPVTMIDGDLTWFNNSKDRQRVVVSVHRGPRSIVAQSPSTVILQDAWSWRVGKSPSADYPSVMQDGFGGRYQIDRPSAKAEDLQYGRYFLDGDDSQVWVDLGIVPPQQSFHFRYLCAVQTPGTWTSPSEFSPRWEASARWTRLQAIASPVQPFYPWPPAPATSAVLTPGLHSLALPAWYRPGIDFVDGIACGAAGGGASTNGLGGVSPGTDGTETTITMGPTVITGPGGDGGKTFPGGGDGVGPGDYEYNGTPARGGRGGLNKGFNKITNGTAPGGGGTGCEWFGDRGEAGHPGEWAAATASPLQRTVIIDVGKGGKPGAGVGAGSAGGDGGAWITVRPNMEVDPDE